MMWMQVTSGVGPVECQWVVTRVLEKICEEGERQGVVCELIGTTEGEEKGTLRSGLMALDGEEEKLIADAWEGTIQWIGESPFRRHHRRKNWFVGVEVFQPPERVSWSETELQFEAIRSSGPGGQKVNKTSSAVRLTHLPSGITIVAQEERSQQQNRRLALARLANIMERRGDQLKESSRQELWEQHHSLERGNAKRVFRGAGFVEKVR